MHAGKIRTFKMCDVEMCIYGTGNNAKKVFELVIILPVTLCFLYVNYGVKKVNTMLNTFLSMFMKVINIYYFATATLPWVGFPTALVSFVPEDL